MKVLVTGGAGFIGSHIVDRLLAEGHDVAAIDSLISGKRSNLAGALERGARLHEVDIRDPSLGRLLADERPDTVMHLAAQIDVRISVADPSHDADVNIAGSLNLLNAAREAGTRKIIMASSGGCIYGEPKTLPVKETYRGTPDSPYGISKKVLHDYLAFYRKAHGIDFTVLALANVYGPRQDPTGEAGVVAIFLGAMLTGKQPVIFGDGATADLRAGLRRHRRRPGIHAPAAGLARLARALRRSSGRAGGRDDGGDARARAPPGPADGPGRRPAAAGGRRRARGAGVRGARAGRLLRRPAGGAAGAGHERGHRVDGGAGPTWPRPRTRPRPQGGCSPPAASACWSPRSSAASRRGWRALRRHSWCWRDSRSRSRRCCSPTGPAPRASRARGFATPRR